jgi:hypothetical protein
MTTGKKKEDYMAMDVAAIAKKRQRDCDDAIMMQHA